MAWSIYDFRDHRGMNPVKGWLDGLQKPDRIRMNHRIDMLRDKGLSLCPGLAGPLKESHHLYKIRVNGRVAPRLFLCKGPIHMEEEFTLLYGAFETNDKLPEGTIEAAERNRNAVILSHRERRCEHERIG